MYKILNMIPRGRQVWSPGGGVRVSWSPALARAEPSHILAADSYKLVVRVGEGELGVLGLSGNVSKTLLP